jgi:hypothetical protein
MRDLPPYSQNQLDEDMQQQRLADLGPQLGQSKGAQNASERIAGRATLVAA